MRPVLPLLLVLLASGCSVLDRDASPPPSPYCRGGDPLAGVYHPSRLEVKHRCAVAEGVVERVKFELFDSDVHIELRLDEPYRSLLSRGNDQRNGDLIVEIVPQDRSRVPIPAEGSHVMVVGPHVDDTTHGWMEIHPAWWISSGRIVPASPTELRRAAFLLDAKRNNGDEDGD